MKKLLYAVFILVLLLGSFLAGSWYHSKREAAKINPNGVKLSAVNAAERSDINTNTASDTSSLPAGTVNVSPEKQQLIGVKVATVEKAPVRHTIRVLGRVTLDETRVFRVTVPVDGLVREAGPIVTGDIVRKDEVLATFYNRDFLTAQQTYLYALNTMDRFKDKESEEQLKLTRAQMQSAEENLEFLGMGKTQLQEIARTRQIARNVQLRSSVEGLVLARNVFPGLRFDRSTELFRIGDISKVWILADIFENEAEYYRPGLTARVSLLQQKRTFLARVSSSLPQFDQATRTLKVRLEADNPGYILRPDMFVDVELSINLPPAITVPADAVLDSGLKKTVFVDLGNGLFEPREVETGWRLGNQIEITKGLKVGERIAMSGTFLIDSESRLEMAAAGMYATMSKDPVCGADVSVNKAEKTGRKSTYRGKTYYFSSDECKQQFDKNPEHYVKK